MNKRIISWMDKVFYPNVQNRWDDLLLREVILKYIESHYTVLDIGAGRGRIKEMDFKSLCSYVIGVDPDERVTSNPLLHIGYVGLGDDMPYLKDESVDLVFSDNVLEHVENPDLLYNEIRRVLKPGGYFINKTPNRWHYMPLIATITPTSFHKYINKLRGREESDTFPTYYRANSRKAQKSIAQKHGFSVTEFELIEKRPEYMRMTFMTYPFGILYEKFVNVFGVKDLRSVLISVVQKNTFIDHS